MSTPEELKYFIALKDVIAGKMGEWQKGDHYWCPEQARLTGHAGVGVQIVEDRYRDSMQYDSQGELGAWVKPEPCCPDIAIRLPLPIDPENPERGLVGMINGGHWRLSYNPASEVKYAFEWFRNGHFEGVYAPTPTLALLKALAWQEGVEVE